MLKKILNKLFDKKAREIAKESLKDLSLVIGGLFILGLIIVILNLIIVLI